MEELRLLEGKIDVLRKSIKEKDVMLLESAEN
jgi:hypothetical protein